MLGLPSILSACTETNVPFILMPTPTPNSLRAYWSLANPWGIAINDQGRVWNAGHVNAIEELTATTILAASAASGV
jgi:hypothetical protein